MPQQSPSFSVGAVGARGRLFPRRLVGCLPGRGRPHRGRNTGSGGGLLVPLQRVPPPVAVAAAVPRPVGLASGSRKALVEVAAPLMLVLLRRLVGAFEH